MRLLDVLKWMLAAGPMILGVSAVSSQEFPNKPIRIVAGAAGGGSDFTARQIAQEISVPLGQPVIVDNRGSAVIGAELVAKAPPDGYTLLYGGASFIFTPLLRKTPYDPVKDFSPITITAIAPLVLVVHPSVAAQSVKELIALAKAKPGALNYASTAAGGGIHTAAELFKSMAGVNITHVPYKGAGPSLQAVMRGEVQLMFSDAATLAPFFKSANLRVLAVTSAEPSMLFPGVPTIAAAGLAGYETQGLDGIWAPALTPTAVIDRLNREIVRVLNLREVKQRFLNAGVETVGSSSEQLAVAVTSAITKTAKVIKDAGIRID